MQTESNKSYFSKKIQSKIEVIYNPIVMEKDYIGCALNQYKNKRIVTVARLEPQKRQHILISAFAIFLKSHPGYTLTFYGVGSLKEKLEMQAEELGVSSNVFFPGRTNTVYDSIKDADMFVMTSAFEGMSNSLIEALCLGLPCISTKVSGATDLIKTDVNGILIDVDDTEALVMAMNRIADNTNYSRQLSLHAEETYQLLRADVISNQWINCLK